jgi:hypothetical protein
MDHSKERNIHYCGIDAEKHGDKTYPKTLWLFVENSKDSDIPRFWIHGFDQITSKWMDSELTITSTQKVGFVIENESFTHVSKYFVEFQYNDFKIGFEVMYSSDLMTMQLVGMHYIYESEPIDAFCAQSFFKVPYHLEMVK